MSDFVIVTDSSCDVAEKALADWGVQCVQLDVLVDGAESCKNNEIEPHAFYEELRGGKMARTSAANITTFKEAFEPFLQEGKDVLYLGFSSGLSTTYQSASIAAEELKEAYTDRVVLTVDTLAASLGQGLLVYLAVQQQEKGATIAEVAAYVQETLPHLAHWFTVDDLNFLKRGGRISGAVALVGTMLGIKPVLHMDDEGHLINMSKSRGRLAAITALADKYGETVTDKTAPVFISHGDCLSDAQTLADILNEKYGVKVQMIDFVGPVIGAHSGPGTLALFFLASKR